MDGPPSKYSLFSKHFFRALDAKHDARRSRFTNASFAGATPVTPTALDERLMGRGNADSKTFRAWTAPSPLARSSNETMMSSFCSSASGSFACSDDLSASHLMSPLSHDIRVQGWMYWARCEDSDTQQQPQRVCRYTKVFVVLRNEFLLLYRSSTRGSSKLPTPLVQIAVASTTRGEDGAFHVIDPYGETMELYLYNREDDAASWRWEAALEHASELTQWHFSAFDVKVEDLSRGSMYRGTLHDSRVHQARGQSLRKTMHSKIKGWSSLRNVLMPVARLAHRSRRSAP
jgi:hypothetical protein